MPTNSKIFKTDTQHTLVWVMVGVLLGVPFLVESLWWTVIPGALALLVVVTASQKNRKFFWLAVLVGTTKAGAGVLWFWYAYPATWFNLQPGLVQFGVAGLYWGTVALSLGLGFGIVIYAFKALISRSQSFVWLFPLVLVAADVAGSLIFSIYSIGPGAIPNMHFSFGYSGYPLLEAEVFYGIATLGGVYALTFFLGALSASVYHAFNRSARVLGVANLVFIGMILATPVLVDEPTVETQELSITVVETYFDPDTFSTPIGIKERAKHTYEAVETALASETNIVLLPEDSRWVDNFYSPEFALGYLVSKRDDVVVIDSARVIDERGKTVLRAFIFDARTKTIAHVDKQYLVPQGEFIPFLAHAVMRLFAAPELINRLERDISYRPGLKDSYDAVAKDIPGVLFCMESISPIGVQKIITKRALPVVLHPISHGWFREPEILWFNLDRMLKAQAIWNQVTVVEAGNQARSKVYWPDGRVTEGSLLKKTQYWSLKEVHSE